MSPAPLTHHDAVQNRRVQLRRWIDEHFGGSQTAFIASTADGEKQVNQGELSGLLKTKSFGEKRARSLELQSGMPPGYLDSTAQPGELTAGYRAEEQMGNVVPVRKTVWPFSTVTLGRLMDLKSALGPRLGNEALREMDSVLSALALKWEQVAASKKKQAR